MTSSLPASSTLCVDANLVAIRVSDPNDVAIRQLWSHWRSEGRRFVAPNLIWYEVANVLHQMWRSGRIGSAPARAALDAALNIGIVVHAGDELHRQGLDLARRLNLPAAYDAHYLALAERLGLELWTADKKLVNTVGAVLPRVELAPGQTIP